MKSLGRAVAVFALMALITLHTGTGVLASFTEKTPRAVEGIDTLIQAGLVSWLGRTNTLMLLAFLTLLLPVLAYLRSEQDRAQKSPPEAATVTPARMQRAIDRKLMPETRQDDTRLLAALAEGVSAQVAQGHGMMKANERPKPFVRLVPQVPILHGQTPRSWFGGNPSLPAGTVWPVCDGKPALFLAQIDCSDLPPGLWEGAGPHSGWLSFFLGYENGCTSVKVLHTKAAGAPAQSPSPVDFEWQFLSETPGMDWTSLVRKDIARWPVDIVWIPSGENDPIVRAKAGSNDGNPRFTRHHTGFDLDNPGWKPFDWATTLLLLDTAAAHARDAARIWHRDLDRTSKILEKVGINPERHKDSNAVRERAEDELVRAKHFAAAWETLLQHVEALRAKVAAEAPSVPFSAARFDELTVTLSAMTVPDRQGEQPVPAFPLVCPPKASACWLTNWATLAQHHAAHLYAHDARALPPAWRARVEEQAAFDALQEMGSMREVPEGYVHEFAMGSEVTLLQLPTSHLMNWIWGDTYDLVLTIRTADLARSDFGRVKVQITN